MLLMFAVSSIIGSHFNDGGPGSSNQVTTSIKRSYRRFLVADGPNGLLKLERVRDLVSLGRSDVTGPFVGLQDVPEA